ncbi:MAG TPA: amidohydrolase, partial [Planctomycetota bacterium]
MSTADLLLEGGRITTQDPALPEADWLAVAGSKVLASGRGEPPPGVAGARTRRIALDGRRVIPGLNDSHLHVIRAGLNYFLELRWDGLGSLAEGLERLRERAASTPPPQWVRVVGGWNAWQFAERRMPTLEELNRAAPETPVMVLHLYDSALLNRAALRALGFDASTPNPPGGLIARDAGGNPTGLLVAEPNAFLLYSTLARAPKLAPEEQLLSTRHFLRELNRFGVTSVSDAGGGWQNYPEDYAIVRALAERGEMTLRVAYSLFAQKPGAELADYTRWIGMTRPGEGDAWLRVNGAGENLVWSAADFENFLQPRPDLRPVMEAELEAVVRALVAARWPFRIHATYDETIQRFLAVFERVDREVPFAGLRWFFDHCETVSPASLERVAALGGGIAIQHRMAFQGEAFVRRFGRAAARATPPVRAMLRAGLPVGAGTDGTRVASYHPWTCLQWLVTGRTVGGTELTAPEERLTRAEALGLYTHGSAWMSGEEDSKGRLVPGALADLAVLDADYFRVPEEAIRDLQAELTLTGGRIVHASGAFAALAPALPPVAPGWSPVARYGGWAGTARDRERAPQPAVLGADGRLWGPGCG